MSASKDKASSVTPDLTSQTDFQLLNAFLSLVSKEQSQPLTTIAWEIMRRYSSFLDKSVPTKPKDYDSILGIARWGDAKRVEEIFGIKRGVLIGLRDAGLIKTNSPEKGRREDGEPPAARAKRLYDLISIVEFLESRA